MTLPNEPEGRDNMLALLELGVHPMDAVQHGTRVGQRDIDWPIFKWSSWTETQENKARYEATRSSSTRTNGS